MDGEKDADAPVENEKPEEIGKGSKERIKGVIAEKFLPEIIKRGLESGLEAILSPDSGLKRVIPDLRIRREMAEYLIRQVDETKNLALRVVASEVRSFLENTNMEDGLRRLLTSIAFEVRADVRFVPAEGGGVKPKVKADVTKMERPTKARRASKRKPRKQT
jgi:hypothetical protein